MNGPMLKGGAVDDGLVSSMPAAAFAAAAAAPGY